MQQNRDGHWRILNSNWADSHDGAHAINGGCGRQRQQQQHRRAVVANIATSAADEYIHIHGLPWELEQPEVIEDRIHVEDATVIVQLVNRVYDPDEGLTSKLRGKSASLGGDDGSDDGGEVQSTAPRARWRRASSAPPRRSTRHSSRKVGSQGRRPARIPARSCRVLRMGHNYSFPAAPLPEGSF